MTIGELRRDQGLLSKYRQLTELLCNQYDSPEICYNAALLYQVEPDIKNKTLELRQIARQKGEKKCKESETEWDLFGFGRWCNKTGHDYYLNQPFDNRKAAELYNIGCYKGDQSACDGLRDLGITVNERNAEDAHNYAKIRDEERREEGHRLAAENISELKRQNYEKEVRDAQDRQDRRDMINAFGQTMQQVQQQQQQYNQQVNDAWKQVRDKKEENARRDQMIADQQRQQQANNRQQQDTYKQKEQQRIAQNKIEQDRKDREAQDRRDREKRELEERERVAKEAERKAQVDANIYQPGAEFDLCTYKRNDDRDYLYVRNSCGERIEVHFQTVTGTSGKYGIAVNGESMIPWKLSQLKDSFAFCRPDYIPVNAHGTDWKAGQDYRCKRLY